MGIKDHVHEAAKTPLQLGGRERHEIYGTSERMIAELSTHDLTRVIANDALMKQVCCVERGGITRWRAAQLIADELLRRGRDGTDKEGANV